MEPRWIAASKQSMVQKIQGGEGGRWWWQCTGEARGQAGEGSGADRAKDRRRKRMWWWWQGREVWIGEEGRWRWQN